MSALALMMLLAPTLGGSGPTAQLATDVGAVAFLVSGYGLLAFRDTFVPFRPATMRLITLAIVVIGLFDIALQLPAGPDSPHTPLQTVALSATVGIWAFCILEPIVTFWLASRGRPAVEMARLRALSAGYAALLLVILTGTLAGSFNPGIQVIVDVVALAIVPVLYIGFFPPAPTGYQPEAYSWAFGLFLVLQILALGWYILAPGLDQKQLRHAESGPG